MLGVSAVIGLAPYMRANAYQCCDPWGAVGFAAFVQAGAAMVGGVEAAAVEISQYLEVSLSQSINNGFSRWADELNKGAAQQRLIAQGRVQSDAQLYLEGKRVAAAEAFQEASMLDEAVTNGLMLSEQQMRNRDQRRAEGLALSEYLRPSAGAVETAQARHGAYCDERGVAIGLCPGLAPSTLQNADISVGTILNPGDGQYDSLSDEELAAGRAFVRNVIAPNQFPALKSDAPQAQAHEAMLLADQAALSLAANSLNTVMLNRVRKGAGKEAQ